MNDQCNNTQPKSDLLRVSNVELRFVEDGRDGLVAWVSCVVGDAIALSNIALRRGSKGDLFLTYPARQTSSGARFHYFNPIHQEAGVAIRDAVVRAVVDLLGEAAPFSAQASVG